MMIPFEQYGGRKDLKVIILLNMNNQITVYGIIGSVYKYISIKHC